MSKGAPNNITNSIQYEKRNNSREFREEEGKLNDKNLPKNMNFNESKQEYDLKDKDIEDIEKLTNSKIICNIGYGGFSTVKLIFNNQQKSYFAMKVINLKNKKFKKKTQSKNREFIYQEILVNFNTRNHNIIKLYGYFNHKEYVLLILEYMNNRDLKYFMKKFHAKYSDSNFSEVLTAFFINQILKALGYLKIRNILHRDIKPENIMLNSSYISKLGDFSLSRKVDMNNPFKTSRSGTLPYLSPECVKKKIEIKPYLCEKLDLFSLGVVMYFLLFNRHPFEYKNQMNVKEYGKKLDEVVLNFEGNKITEKCKSFLSGLLEKNINKRFSFDQAVNHPWIVLIKEKVDEISSNYSTDPDKMIHELNKCIVTNEFFEEKKSYTYINTFQTEPISKNEIEKLKKNAPKNDSNFHFKNFNSIYNETIELFNNPEVNTYQKNENSLENLNILMKETLNSNLLYANNQNNLLQQNQEDEMKNNVNKNLEENIFLQNIFLGNFNNSQNLPNTNNLYNFQENNNYIYQQQINNKFNLINNNIINYDNTHQNKQNNLQNLNDLNYVCDNNNKQNFNFRISTNNYNSNAIDNKLLNTVENPDDNNANKFQGNSNNISNLNSLSNNNVKIKNIEINYISQNQNDYNDNLINTNMKENGNIFSANLENFPTVMNDNNNIKINEINNNFNSNLEENKNENNNIDLKSENNVSNNIINLSFIQSEKNSNFNIEIEEDKFLGNKRIREDNENNLDLYEN